MGRTQVTVDDYAAVRSSFQSQLAKEQDDEERRVLALGIRILDLIIKQRQGESL